MSYETVIAQVKETPVGSAAGFRQPAVILQADEYAHKKAGEI